MENTEITKKVARSIIWNADYRGACLGSALARIRLALNNKLTCER